MKITKYEHACLDIQESGSRLIIDPGVFTHSLTDFDSITALVITHIHPDHFDPKKAQDIISNNPEVSIFTTIEVAEQINHKNITTPKPAEDYKIESLTLEFYGVDHAEIMPTYPLAQNIGVLVNDTLYYPGDSFTACPKSYKILAAPAHAPWLKFSEVAKLTEESPATTVFPTHNGFLNQDGNDLVDRLFGKLCENYGKTYKFIKPCEAIEV